MRVFLDGGQRTSVDVLLDVVMERNSNKAYASKVYRTAEKNLSMKMNAEEAESRNPQTEFHATQIALEGNGLTLNGSLALLLVVTLELVEEQLIVSTMLIGKSMIDIVKEFLKMLLSKSVTEFHVQSGFMGIGQSVLDLVMVELK